MTRFGDEPDLALGDSGEWVTKLQARLQAISLYTGATDGSYGDATMQAVAALQAKGGVPDSGTVDAATWLALLEAEQSAGISSHPTGDPLDGGKTPIGTLSEDEHWRWDGEQWQANEDRHEVPPAAVSSGGRQRSADGQWLWDGNQWQPVS